MKCLKNILIWNKYKYKYKCKYIINMTSIDLNVNNYSAKDLLGILEIDINNITLNETKQQCDNYINQFKKEEKNDLVTFFSNVKTRVLSYIEEIITDEDDVIDLEEDENNLNVVDEYEDEYDESEKEEINMWNIDENDETKLIDTDNRDIIENKESDTRSNIEVSVAKGIVNPTKQHTITRIINIDSQYRQNVLLQDNAGDYTIDLSEPLVNVLSLKMYSIQIPYSWYTIDSIYGTNIFWIGDEEVLIDPGNYTQKELVNHINTKVNSKLLLSYNSNNGKITIENTSGNIIKLYFYNTSRNAIMKKNHSLGWLMGFKKAEYEVEIGNSIISEGLCDLYGTKYVLLQLDDFKQNHINTGLINVIDSEDNKLKLPGYFNRDLSYNIDSAGLFQVLPEYPRKLTLNQMYSINEINKNRTIFKTNDKLIPPINTDILALIPIKHNNMPIGESYIESGGHLQVNERKYFGPVTISKFRIRLLNDKGFTVNLNGCDWSFGIVCETLYQY